MLAVVAPADAAPRVLLVPHLLLAAAPAGCRASTTRARRAAPSRLCRACATRASTSARSTRPCSGSSASPHSVRSWRARRTSLACCSRRWCCSSSCAPWMLRSATGGWATTGARLRCAQPPGSCGGAHANPGCCMQGASLVSALPRAVTFPDAHRAPCCMLHCRPLASSTQLRQSLRPYGITPVKVKQQDGSIKLTCDHDAVDVVTLLLEHLQQQPAPGASHGSVAASVFGARCSSRVTCSVCTLVEELPQRCQLISCINADGAGASSLRFADELRCKCCGDTQQVRHQGSTAWRAALFGCLSLLACAVFQRTRARSLTRMPLPRRRHHRRLAAVLRRWRRARCCRRRQCCSSSWAGTRCGRTI